MVTYSFVLIACICSVVSRGSSIYAAAGAEQIGVFCHELLENVATLTTSVPPCVLPADLCAGGVQCDQPPTSCHIGTCTPATGCSYDPLSDGQGSCTTGDGKQSVCDGTGNCKGKCYLEVALP